jgi:hypothetical protein
MSLTLVKGIADVRQLLNEPTAVFWTDLEIEDWIKEGTRIIVSKTHGVEATGNITLVQNQLSYTSTDSTWIGDCMWAYAALYNNGANKYKGLQFIHPKQIGNLLTFTAGDPKYYSFFNRAFYIWPLPSSTIVGNTVLTMYAKETEDFTLLPDEFQHLAIMWGQAKAYEKDMKHAQAAAIKQNFYSEMQFERNDKTTRPGEPARGVKAGVPTDGRT